MIVLFVYVFSGEYQIFVVLTPFSLQSDIFQLLTLLLGQIGKFCGGKFKLTAHSDKNRIKYQKQSFKFYYLLQSSKIKSHLSYFFPSQKGLWTFIIFLGVFYCFKVFNILHYYFKLINSPFGTDRFLFFFFCLSICFVLKFLRNI